MSEIHLLHHWMPELWKNAFVFQTGKHHFYVFRTFFKNLLRLNITRKDDEATELCDWLYSNIATCMMQKFSDHPLNKRWGLKGEQVVSRPHPGIWLPPLCKKVEPQKLGLKLTYYYTFSLHIQRHRKHKYMVEGRKVVSPLTWLNKKHSASNFGWNNIRQALNTLKNTAWQDKTYY